MDSLFYITQSSQRTQNTILQIKKKKKGQLFLFFRSTRIGNVTLLFHLNYIICFKSVTSIISSTFYNKIIYHIIYVLLSNKISLIVNLWQHINKEPKRSGIPIASELSYQKYWFKISQICVYQVVENEEIF